MICYDTFVQSSQDAKREKAKQSLPVFKSGKTCKYENCVGLSMLVLHW